MSRVRAQLHSAANWFRELFGKAAPRTSELSEEAGNAITRYNSAGTAARLAAPEMIDLVAGPGTSPERLRQLGAAYTELRLRYMRLAYQRRAAEASSEAARARASGDGPAANEAARRSTDAMNDAAGVATLVGGDRSPLPTEADFQRLTGGVPLRTAADFEAALNSPELRETTARWRRHMVPEMERNFREAQGLEHDDPISAFTQIPGFPINLKAARPGELVTEGTAFAAGGRGNLRNVRLSKLGFARRATGAAAGYETDLGAVIENSLAQGYRAAGKNAMIRSLLEAGIAQRARPGEHVEIGGEPARKIDFVFRQEPAWADPADRGRENLHVREGAYDEVRRALAPDEPTRFELLRGGLGVVTRATLASLGEMAAHAKNMGTFFFRPGTSLIDFYHMARGVMAGDEAVSKRVIELARMGAMKDSPGMESGAFWGGHWDPTHWTGRFIDFLQTTMRLTADRAFDKLEASGRVEGGERNRRDFINQLGNYNKKSQSRLVAWLRDTGIGPFATAGSNYFAQGLRSLVMDPGAKATSWGHAAGLRAEMLSRTAGVMALAPLMNYLLWGRADGDDNTAWGDVKLGVTAEGRTASLPLAALTGFPRGAREVGLTALVQGVQRGATPGQTVDRMVGDVVASVANPAFGPGAQFLHTALSGEGHRGQNVTQPVGPGGSVAMNRLGAALANANPAVAALTGLNRPGRDTPMLERVAGLGGPVSPRFRSEVDELRDRYRLIEEERNQWAEQRRRGQAFPREAEYARLHAFVQAVRQLDAAAEGIGSSGRARRQGERPPEDRRQQIRNQQVEIARRALSAR